MSAVSKVVSRCAASLRVANTKVSSTIPQCFIQSSAAESTQGADSLPRRKDPAVANNMLDIGIREIFSEEHDIFRRSVRHFMDQEVKPKHEQWEERGYVDKDVWLAAGEQGLLGINTAEEHGGLGGDWILASIVHEEGMYSNCTGPGFNLHSDVFLPYLTNYGTPEQLKKYMPDMIAGKRIGAIAMTEPGAGSDLQGIRTRAHRQGEDWILNGSKVFITNGYLCDLVIVVAVTNPDARVRAHGITLFLVEAGTEGFTKGKPLHKMGYKAQDTCEMFFEDVRLPADAILGKENQGFYCLMNELPQERLIIGNMAISHSEFMFEETRRYVRERKGFGKTMAHLQTIQHRLAEMKTKICIGRAFQDQLMKRHNDDKLDSQQASMSKYWLSDLENEVATECLQMHGGWGYMMEYPISKAFVDARLHPIFGGTNEIMKELIARSIITDN